MFSTIQPLANDPILSLAQQFHDDPRCHKIDVGVGIYQNDDGDTPVMRAVKQAEQRVWTKQTSKKYLGLAGNPAYNHAIAKLVLGDQLDSERTRINQTIAGTGAIRLIAETLFHLMPKSRVWVPDPTWGNHIPIFAAAGYSVRSYPYYDRDAAVLRRQDFFAAMDQFGSDDIVLLHGCCHNPSGTDLTRQDWDMLVDIAVKRGFLPIVDLAYLGLGDDIAADAYGVRLLAERVESMFVGVSCSKNFGLYRDRVGAAIMIAKNAHTVHALQTHLEAASRAMISMPADHGAAVVAEILHDSALYRQWTSELAAMVAKIKRHRQALADALTEATGKDWAFITHQRGMFSLLPLGAERVKRLRDEYAIYAVGEGRINLSGLHKEGSAALAAAIKSIG